jgi:hypothetical protein
MATTFPCERVDVSFTETAPYRFSNGVDLAITPEQLFEVLADAEAWRRWASVITNVTWTSPEPRGVGTTRTVDMRDGIVGDVGAPPALRGRISHLGSRLAAWLFDSMNAQQRLLRRSPKTTGSRSFQAAAG